MQLKFVVELFSLSLMEYLESLDMQKFPLRMKDNDLLVTELYKDPTLDHITAISVYLTPKTTSEYIARIDRYTLHTQIHTLHTHTHYIYRI